MASPGNAPRHPQGTDHGFAKAQTSEFPSSSSGSSVAVELCVSNKTRTVSASIEITFVRMESKRLLFASSDENECYLYAKRIKIESNQKIIEKEEQQNLKQSIHSVNSYQTTPNEPVYLSEKQNSWALEKQTSENKQSTKKRSSENETRIPMKDNVSLNVCGQPLKAELHNDVSNTANIGRNLRGLNPSQMQQNNIQQNNRRNGDNDLKQNSSVTPLNIDLFQTEMLSHKSDSDKKWKKYQLLQSPFLCGTSSVFSHKEHEKNNFLKKVCTAGDKDYSSNVSETTIERDNKEKKNSSYVIPTLKPFKSLQLLEIPNFQFPSISNKLNSKIPSTHLKEMDWESFKGQSSLVQSQQIHGVQKMTETGKHKMQNDRSSVKASTVGSEFKEKNYPSVSKQEHGALAEGGKVSLTCFRENSTDIECNQIFAENNFKDKMQENSDSDDDQKSRIYIYISAKNVQNEKCINCNDLLKRMGWKSSNDNTDTLHIQMNVPVITEALEKNKLDVYWDVRNSNSDIILYEAESKLSTKEILGFKRNTLLSAGGKFVRVENYPLCGKKQVQLNSCTDNTMWQTTEFHEENETYQGFVNSKFVENLDKIPVVNQDSSVTEKLSEENAITCSKQVHNLPARSNDVLVLPEQSKTTLEKCNSVFLQGSQTNTREYCETIDTCSPNLANEKLEDQNTYSRNFENLFPSSSDVYHSDTLPLDNRSSGNEERVISECGHCRSSSSADKRDQSEKNHASIQYPSAESPTMTNTDLRLQAMETEPFSLQEHTEISKGVSLEPTTLKHIEYVEEQEEISDEQMHVANESRCETVMNDLIMSHSKDKSKTFFAAEEKLKMHLPVMNNGHLEDAEDKYLPLENEITYEFELKKKFDLVLEELHMFHEISKGNENNLSSLETNSHSNYCELNNSVGIDENATSASQKKMLISSPICVAIEGQNISDNNESSLNKKISNENEDENPSREYCTSRLSNEELLHSPVAEGYFDAAYNKAYTWNPAFLSCTLFSEQNYNLPKEGGYFLSREVMRVQPLKTCKGPIKIGLSRKARPKQLHPYLK
ncbi:RAD51-associated protein 2 [Phaenicophaeus curvirostris]|uniref:RAD51-associated protein 2 n=1 Tax=Phaenicophaeus curvirostris TaxID=33595 RepID=UPI0037F0BD5F